ncbi:MAG: uncharacterized protein JWN37_658 [Candidatus Nomurabacteria bacterium]|nr:uncharacterized protein [Candidatus Nomurabacteria bacterium]
MIDLAPEIFRQRLVIEGIPHDTISALLISNYLKDLSVQIDMVTLIEPITHRSEKFGWLGWIHWETSGAHFYAWETPILFFSVDIYTCKRFDAQIAVNFTKEFFNCNSIEYKEF